MTRGSWFSLLSQELRTLLPLSLSRLGAAGSDCRRLWDRPETGGREGTAFSGRSARFCAFGLRLHSLGGRLTGVGKPAHCPLPSVPRTSWPGGMNGLAHPQVQATFIVNDSHESRPGALPAPFQVCTGEAGSAVACPREASLPPCTPSRASGVCPRCATRVAAWQSAPWPEPWLRAESAFRSFAVRGATCQVSNRGGCRPRFGSGCGAAVGRGHGPRGASASAVRAERSGPFPRGSLRPGAQTWRLPRVRACARGGGSGQQPLHPGVDEGEAAEQVLVHAVDEPAVGGGQPRPLAQELLVEVAAVARRFLGRGWRGGRGEGISRRAVSATAVTPAGPWATP